MAEEQRRARGGIGEGIRTGIGILGAFKDAFEETLQEAVDRGDLSPDRARETMRGMAQRLQEGLGDARERLDFVSRREYEELRREVDGLRERLARLEGGGETPGGQGGPDTPGIIITE